ncbi:MAG: recombinase family protein [Deltaproteobacteria bacterium]|nr:recombinase family protein [Deltaproteobacteria bacterium]
MISIALYARVSSAQQAQRATIDSQVAALQGRAAADGHRVSPDDLYLDDGFSGTTLMRPGLERLRDRVAEGAIDLIYVHSPDRLARRYAYQVLLLEEFAARRVRSCSCSARAGDGRGDPAHAGPGDGRGVRARTADGALPSRQAPSRAAGSGQSPVGRALRLPLRRAHRHGAGGVTRLCSPEAEVVRGLFDAPRPSPAVDRSTRARPQHGGCPDAAGRTALGSLDGLGHPAQPRVRGRSGVRQDGVGDPRPAAPTDPQQGPAPPSSGSRSPSRHS